MGVSSSQTSLKSAELSFEKSTSPKGERFIVERYTDALVVWVYLNKSPLGINELVFL